MNLLPNKLPEEFLQYTEGVREGLYKSLEHHFGLGVQISFYNQFYLNGDFGFGAYFGSIKKPVFNPVLLQLRGGNGLAMKAKIGLGINLFQGLCGLDP